MRHRFTFGLGGLHGLHVLHVSRQRRHVLPRCVLALALALPGAAYPISLPQLLRLPLEELLRLEISRSTSAPRPRSGATSALPAPTGRSVA